MTSKAEDTIQVAERYEPIRRQVLAVKWDGTPEHGKVIEAWSQGQVRNAYVNRAGIITVEPGNNPALQVHTPYGEKIAQPTDYVIRTERGSFFTDPASLFESEYTVSE